jgi:hypothetical protein
MRRCVRALPLLLFCPLALGCFIRFGPTTRPQAGNAPGPTPFAYPAPPQTVLPRTEPAGAGQPSAPKPPEPDILPVSAKELGQALYHDEKSKAFGRYVPHVLQIEGLVKEQSKGADGSITEVVFLEPVVDKKTSARDTYRIWCRFSQPIQPGSPAAAQVAMGQRVTIRGRLTGADLGSPQATLNDCALVAGRAAPARP